MRAYAAHVHAQDMLINGDEAQLSRS